MTIGYLKGKSATRIHRELLPTKGTMFGRSFWARGYCVSTVGLDEDQIRRYIPDQEKLQRDRTQGDFEPRITQRPLQGAFLIPPALPVVADSQPALNGEGNSVPFALPRPSEAALSR